MQEFVLKREANVTSAEALDQISAAYPDAEILSFRRIKEAGNDQELYVARLRTSVMDDVAPVDVTPADNDVIIEGKEHENKEEALMQQAVDMIKEILDEVKSDDAEEVQAEEDLDQKQLEMEELPNDKSSDDSPVFNALPEDVRPPLMSEDKISKITVARLADVSKATARIELIREFAPQGYRISSFNEGGGRYFVDLVRTSADEVERQEKYNPYAPGTKEPKMFTDTRIKGQTYMGDQGRRLEAIRRFMDREKVYPMGAEGARQKEKDFQKAQKDFEAAGGIPLDAEKYLMWFWEAIQSEIADAQNNPQAMDDAIALVDQEYKTIMSLLPDDRIEYAQDRAREIAPALGIKIPKEFMPEAPYNIRDEPIGERGPATPAGKEELNVQDRLDEAAVPEELQAGWSLPESFNEVKEFANSGERLDDLLSKFKSPGAKALIEHMREISFADEDQLEEIVRGDFASVVRQDKMVLQEAQEAYRRAEQSGDEDAIYQAEIALQSAGDRMAGRQKEIEQKIKLLIDEQPINQKMYLRAVQMGSRITDVEKQEAYLRREFSERVPSQSKLNPGGAIKEVPQRQRERMITPKNLQKNNPAGTTRKELRERFLQHRREQRGTVPMRNAPSEVYMPQEEAVEEFESERVEQ